MLPPPLLKFLRCQEKKKELNKVKMMLCTMRERRRLEENWLSYKSEYRIENHRITKILEKNLWQRLNSSASGSAYFKFFPVLSKLSNF